MSEDFNNNLNPLAKAVSSENMEVSIRSKKEIISAQQSKILPLDRVELTCEIEEMDATRLREIKTSEELNCYIDTMRQMPAFNLSDLEYLINHPENSSKGKFNQIV